MFSKSDAKSNNNQVAGAPALNMVSEGTTLEGNIRSENDIRISGRLEGEAVSKGRVIVTSSGSVKGNVKAADADVAGKFDGELHISGKLVLRASAEIIGDIHAKTLLVEEGAKISGNCKMSSDGNPALNAESKNRQPLQEPIEAGALRVPPFR